MSGSANQEGRGNTHRFWSLANAKRRIGYAPEDDSQVNFADKIAAIVRR